MYVPMPITDIALPLRHGMLYKNQSQVLQKCLTTTYLRYALYNAAKYVCHWDSTFAGYLARKRAEGKHYNVALSHAVKKLLRVIYHLEKSNQQYIKSA